MLSIVKQYQATTNFLNHIGEYIAPLILRLVLAWEFGEAGYQKLMGTNWFYEIAFPFPFSLLPADLNWQLATSFELLGALALLFGFATRFFSMSLIVITIVAIAAVHWPTQWHSLSDLITGYRIIDENGDGFGNYKLPVIYICMLIPLLLQGAGKISLDNFIKYNYIDKRYS